MLPYSRERFDNLVLFGGSVIVVFRPGCAPEIVVTPNVLTTVGKQRAASHLASMPTKTWFTHIALGDNSDTEPDSETLSLVSEIHREVLSSTFAIGVTCFGDFSITASDIGAGSYVVRELGLLDAAAGGNLICAQNLAEAITISGAERIDGLWGVIVT